MIGKAIKFIVDELNNVIDDDMLTQAMDTSVRIGNISRLSEGTDASSTDLNQKIIVTLVNIEEEKTLKNTQNFIRDGDKIKKFQPTIYLNLYLLFSCADKDYMMALTRIGRIIAFFQKTNVFVPGSTNTPLDDKIEKLIFEMYGLNFEQQNHLWGILGGKQLPSVLYKVRLVMIQGDTGKDGPMIKEIKATENSN